jgi:hypothetical protein
MFAKQIGQYSALDFTMARCSGKAASSRIGDRLGVLSRQSFRMQLMGRT